MVAEPPSEPQIPVMTEPMTDRTDTPTAATAPAALPEAGASETRPSETRLPERRPGTARARDATLLDRTVTRLGRAWREATGTARLRLAGHLRPDLPDDDLERLRRQIDDCLAGRGGEGAARLRAAELGRAYLTLSATGRERFFRLLAAEYGPAPGALEEAVAAWQAAADELERHRSERRMRQALSSPRIVLLRQFNILDQGVKFLVDMRADLLALRDSLPEADAAVFQPVDDDIREILVGWFDVGFLDLTRITWQAPAALLEKLIAYEAVHRIESWDDLKSRLDSDRRCYAFFHPRMPDEPLIFVEIALVDGIAGDVQELLEREAPPLDPREADTAIFYSISNCQKGLRGVSFGNFLIKRVVEELRRDLPNLKTFSTLSPIPDFRRWLDRELAEKGDELLLETERRALAPFASGQVETAPAAVLAGLLQRPDWPEDGAAREVLEPVLMRLCAGYLLAARRGRRAADRVGHFHLSNGARIERLNWLGDRSAKGLREAAGLMVNYRYKLDEIDENHEAYRTDGTVAALGSVRRLARS